MVVVAEGATFDMADAANGNVLASVTEICLGANAKFVMFSQSVMPFTNFAVTLHVTSTSEFSLPEGALFKV